MLDFHQAPKFPLGRLLITPAAQTKLSEQDIKRAIRRHAVGDWGELDTHDKQANEASLEEGCRLLSAYRAANGAPFWIITEADRSVTTILLPEDY